MFNADKARKLLKKYRSKKPGELSWIEKVDCYLQVRKACKVMREVASEGHTRNVFYVENNHITGAVVRHLEKLGFDCDLSFEFRRWCLWVSFKEESND